MTADTAATTPASQEPREPRGIEIGAPISGSHVSSRRVGLLAAVSALGSTDPVDAALLDALDDDLKDQPYLRADPSLVDPARADRRYQLATVPNFPDSSGTPHNIVVMRGELEAVLHAANAPRSARAIHRKNAQMFTQRGYRVLAVASARLADDGTMSKYVVHGIVPVRQAAGGDFKSDAMQGVGSFVRVNVWTGLLRWQHWANVAAVFILSCTGYYIMDPFFGPWYFDGVETGYFMGWVRLVHFVTAFIWLGIGLTRLVLLFVSRDRYLRWRALWPLNSRQDLRNTAEVAQHYLFMRDEAPLYLAHNPLQQLTYTAVYGAGILQMLVGFSLYAVYQPTSAFWQVVALPVSWIGIPGVRLLHAMIMFFLWAFVIAHIYLAVRADSLERHGGVSSMLNGGVWLRRGSKPVDAPEVE